MNFGSGSRTWFGYVQIVTAILIWSSLGIFIRNIDLPNPCIIFYTATVAGAIQFIIIVITGELKRSTRKAHGKESVILFILPFCFIANTMLFYYAFRNTTISNAVLTHYTAPVFVAILAPMLIGERIKRIVWVAIFLSSLGLWLIIGKTNPLSGIMEGGKETLGIMAGALSGLAYAFLIIMIRRIATAYPAIMITFIQNGMVAMILLPFVYDIPLPSSTVPVLFVLGIVHSTIAPLLYVHGFKTVKANEAAILGYFEPVGATILGFFFFKEVPGIHAFIGGVLIIIGGYLTIREGTRVHQVVEP
jgi:drug/metabolite transporter (DMT)-like permease